jgi:tRNA threonylcarbamoyladenosine biosynthesis protein TsaB
MAYLLHIETSTEQCSVCISDDLKILSEQTIFTTNTHTAILTTLIAQCATAANISLSQLQAVSFSAGPGAYTALRAGAATAKGLCYALQIPLIGVDTLEALAYEAIHQHQLHKLNNIYVMPMIDARRMEVYMSIYKGLEKISAPEAKVIDENSFADLFSENNTIYLCGNGCDKFKDIFLKNKNIIFLNILCNAQQLVPLALKKYEAKAWENVAYFEPFYLKMPNITVSQKVL